MSQIEQIKIPPEPEILLSLGRTGYKWTEAVMDIIDNHVDAIKDIWESDPEFVGEVQCRAVAQKGVVKRILFSDNGEGIPKSLLKEILKLGKSDKRHNASSRPRLGVFGMGLKTAGMSLGRKITVISRTNGNVWFVCWEVANGFTCSFGQDDDYTTLFEEEVGTGSGTVVLIDNLTEDVPSRVSGFHPTLRKHCSHVYRHLVNPASTAGFYFPFTMTIGTKEVETVNDPLAYTHAKTSVLIGAADGSFEEHEAPDGTKVWIRMVHHRRNSGGDESAHREKYDNLPGAYMPGNHYKQGVYWIRQGREIYRGSFWKNMQGISNVYAEVVFEDCGTAAAGGKVSMDFGKKGVVIEDELAKWLKTYVFAPKVKEALKAVQKARTKANENTLEELAKSISERVLTPNTEANTPQVSQGQSKLRTILNRSATKTNRKNSKYRGQDIDVGGGTNIQYDIEFRSWPGDIAYDLETEDLRWVLVINEAHPWVKDRIIEEATTNRAQVAFTIQMMAAHAKALQVVTDDESRADILQDTGYLLKIYDSSFGELNLETEDTPCAFEEDEE